MQLRSILFRHFEALVERAKFRVQVVQHLHLDVLQHFAPFFKFRLYLVLKFGLTFAVLIEKAPVSCLINQLIVRIIKFAEGLVNYRSVHVYQLLDLRFLAHVVSSVTAEKRAMRANSSFRG